MCQNGKSKVGDKRKMTFCQKMSYKNSVVINEIYDNAQKNTFYLKQH